MVDEIYNSAKDSLISEIKKVLVSHSGRLHLNGEGVFSRENFCHNDRWNSYITDIKFAKFSKNLMFDEKFKDDDIVFSETGCYDQKIENLSVDMLYKVAKSL